MGDKLKSYHYLVTINHSANFHLLIRNLICYFPNNLSVYSIEKVLIFAFQSKTNKKQKQSYVKIAV